MESLVILKNTFAPIRKPGAYLTLALALLLGLITGPPAKAIDNRTIDIVSISWRGSPALAGGVDKAQEEIEKKVGPLWRNLTTISGDPEDKRIQFNFGRSLAEPIQLSFAMPCDNNFATWTTAVRVETYKRLGIVNWQSRYLLILAPDAGCIWSGRALLGEAKEPGGSLVLHNSVSGFVVAHELGHGLGLGHSNLMRCGSGNSDGPWSSCRAIEYGGSVDLMSNVDVSTPLSTYHQWRMGLLNARDIKQSWLSESIEINAVDVYGRARAIFLRDGDATYWVEYRKASANYQTGLVIYRTDPPPNSSVISPNAYDSQQDLTNRIGTDIWMLNLDSYNYGQSRSTGSMSLGAGKSATLYSGNIGISLTTTSDTSAVVNITRRESNNLSKPILTSTNTWRSPDALILDSSYNNSLSAIEGYEADIDGVIQAITPSKVEGWSPTYLDPFTEPKVLKLEDLPEGQYLLSIRVKSYLGNWSPWSDKVNVNIDRAAPIMGSDYAISKVESGKVFVELSGIRDLGSGLCSSQLVNPEGWILEKSTLKAKPQFSFGSGDIKSMGLQVFDCLGNGRAASITGQSAFTPAVDLKLSGKWISAGNLFPAGSLKCLGRCTAYSKSTGVAGLVLGSGSAKFSVVGASAKSVVSNRSGDSFRVESISLGNRAKTAKVTGSNFVLIGIARAKVTITNISDVNFFASESDPSLEEPIQSVLNRYGFNSADFASEWRIAPMARGTTLEDPTLDLCSAQYDSELLRKERRQVVANKSENPYLFLSSESVRYKSIAAADQALKEVKLSYSNCIKNSGGTERDGLFTKYEFLELPPLPSNLITPSNSVIVHAKIGEDSSTRYLFGAYQYNGDLFTGLYVVSGATRPFSQEELKRWLDVAVIMAERLKS